MRTLLSSLALALVATVLVPALPAEARPSSRAVREAYALDRELVHVTHLRDRGDVSEALTQVRELVARAPESVTAHRLYQEIAVLSRRNGMLVVAEYRHLLDEDPDDPLRLLLHASAVMTAAVVTPELQNRETMRGVERDLTAAEAHRPIADEAHMVAADLKHLLGDVEGVEEHLRAGYKADRSNVAIRSELVLLLASQAQWDEAADLCLDLLDDTPWRLMACAPLLPRRAGERASSPETQERLTDRLEKLEQKRADDMVTLQSLQWLYEYVGERRGAQRLTARLSELDSDWKPALERDPYVQALPGGELTSDEVELIERIQSVKGATAGDAWGRVRALQDLATSPPESRRMQAYLYRELAFALRQPEVMDRDASREAIRLAREATPDDPSVLNEWAYMSSVDSVDLTEALEAVDRALALLLGEPFDLMALNPGQSFSQYEIDRSETAGAFIDTRGWVLYQLGRHQEAVQHLYLASLLTIDGTVQGHLGRARYAVGNDSGAFAHLLRALALGTEEEEAVRDLAQHLYDALHVVPGGLDALIEETRAQLRSELRRAEEEFDLGALLDQGGALAPPGQLGSSAVGEPTVSSRGNHPLLGQEAPDFEFTTLSGQSFDKSSLAGHVVVVDFWATWCEPCLATMPSLDGLSRAFAAEGVVFLAMSLDEDVRTVEGLGWDSESKLEVGLVSDEVVEAFGVRGIPATFLLDQEGRIAEFHSGYDGQLAEQLSMRILQLLQD